MKVWLAIALMFGPAGVASAISYRSEVSARENCRRTVGGGYLQRYERKIHAEHYLLKLRENSVALARRLAELRKTAVRANSDAKTHQYDSARARDRIDRLADVRSVEFAHRENIQLIESALAEVATASEVFNSYEKLVAPLFFVENAQDGSMIGYPRRLDYRSVCPAHYPSCPLPPSSAEQLRTLAPQVADPQSCLRFSQIQYIRS